MKIFLVIALFVAIANARVLRAPGIATIRDLQAREDGKIVGGSQAALNQFPWQASVRIDNAYFCGGSLISTRWIMTAAHCASGSTSFSIGLGSLANNVQQYTTTTKIVHESYNPNTISNDIAVLNLQTDASGANIAPVSLGTANVGGGVAVTVSGWGKTSDSSGIASTLMFARLNTITNTACADYYGSIVIASTICTSTAGGSSTCNGDSGGPLVDNSNNQVGIVSFGASAGCLVGPSAFARVSSFRSWITSNTNV